jgi:hypothetical protein
MSTTKQRTKKIEREIWGERNLGREICDWAFWVGVLRFLKLKTA